MTATPNRERGAARPKPDRPAGGMLVACVPDHRVAADGARARMAVRGLGVPAHPQRGAAMIAGVALAAILDVTAAF